MENVSYCTQKWIICKMIYDLYIVVYDKRRSIYLLWAYMLIVLIHKI